MTEASDKDRGHDWKLYEGEIDIFAFESGFHNGPQCRICGYCYCQHCNDGPQEDCPGAEAVAKEEAERIAKLRVKEAAPDLLAALEAYVYWASNPAGGAGFEPVERARAAIARARGEA